MAYKGGARWYRVSGKVLWEMVGILRGSGKTAWADELEEEAAPIIGDMVWTEEDVRGMDSLDELEDWQVEDVVGRALAGYDHDWGAIMTKVNEDLEGYVETIVKDVNEEEGEEA